MLKRERFGKKTEYALAGIATVSALLNVAAYSAFGQEDILFDRIPVLNSKDPYILTDELRKDVFTIPKAHESSGTRSLGVEVTKAEFKQDGLQFSLRIFNGTKKDRDIGHIKNAIFYKGRLVLGKAKEIVWDEALRIPAGSYLDTTCTLKPGSFDQDAILKGGPQIRLMASL